MATNPARTHPGKKLVRCDVCGSNVECSVEDLLRFTQSGWPKCCGAVMTFYTAADPPDSDGTRRDTPPRPSGPTL